VTKYEESDPEGEGKRWEGRKFFRSGSRKERMKKGLEKRGETSMPKKIRSRNRENLNLTWEREKISPCRGEKKEGKASLGGTKCALVRGTNSASQWQRKT